MDSVDVPESARSDRDPWLPLKRFTAARIALGRTGGSVRTDAQLDFRLSHARARDAVLAPFDPSRIALDLELGGHKVEHLATAATDRQTYLLRPDLGRKLHPEQRSKLQHLAGTWGRRDLAIIISDGLAAQAAERHAVPVIVSLVGLLAARHWTIYPIFIVPLARVKLQDEIGDILGARQTLMLLGERPGLGVPDSLGAYFTYDPRADRTDADRNCVSNIRLEGLPPAAAAQKLATLLISSARDRISGVGLKDLAPVEPTSVAERTSPALSS
jgi:ethanolamine ammonia-lyase small subunit